MKKIIIMDSVGIGDVITAEPLLRKLKKLYPDRKILIYSLRGGYLENHKISYVDEIIRFNRFKNILRFFREKSDILINLGYYSKISGYFKIFLYYLMIFLSRSKKKIFLGDLESFELKNKNMVQIKLDIIKKLNIEIKNSDYNLFLPFSFENEKKKTNKLLSVNKIDESSLLTIIHSGTKGRDFTRLWPPERWVEVINYLIKKYQAKIGFVGGKEDIIKTKEVINILKFPVLNFVGKLSPQETTALISKCKLFISTNSGPMWIAAALHKPQIALCGPSKTAWAPYNKNAIVIKKFTKCMKDILVEDVISAIEQLLTNVKNN